MPRKDFLTPDFLRKQNESLETKLADYQSLRRLALQGIKVSPSDERRGDEIEQALTFGERQGAAQQLEECGKIISQVERALNLIDNSLTGKRSRESYGACINCGKIISQKRLIAIPWAERCVPCQEKNDAFGEEMA